MHEPARHRGPLCPRSRDDPTVLAWSLANEPQCHGDPPGAHTIVRWAGELAGYVKGLDPNHLVTLNCEGFLGPSTPGLQARARVCGGVGCVCVRGCWAGLS